MVDEIDTFSVWKKCHVSTRYRKHVVEPWLSNNYRLSNECLFLIATRGDGATRPTFAIVHLAKAPRPAWGMTEGRLDDDIIHTHAFIPNGIYDRCGMIDFSNLVCFLFSFHSL